MLATIRSVWSSLASEVETVSGLLPRLLYNGGRAGMWWLRDGIEADFPGGPRGEVRITVGTLSCDERGGRRDHTPAGLRDCQSEAMIRRRQVWQNPDSAGQSVQGSRQLWLLGARPRQTAGGCNAGKDASESALAGRNSAGEGRRDAGQSMVERRWEAVPCAQ
ncbi:hypothetical protein K431DRAFT_21262 [Polychaeton citri CBS 116435]|uniref:Uncharacterized protein n=1 Tax=Polychaeton citri CBS 116435 TaxID=1314669 RepID=A0A9P4UKU4_9PEZI|nr:hypothetical protein K431DRAFT_21262 [Polychaeton citri CBS 116435]